MSPFEFLTSMSQLPFIMRTYAHYPRILLSLITLLTSVMCNFSAEVISIGLSANHLSIATGQPSSVMMSGGSVHIPA